MSDLDSKQVAGQCPMGCGSTLFLGNGGYITCSWVKCPNPGAAADLLLDHATPHHIVNLTGTSWTIQHPLRERLLGELFECSLHAYMEALDGPPRVPGRYEVMDHPTLGVRSWRALAPVSSSQDDAG